MPISYGIRCSRILPNGEQCTGRTGVVKVSRTKTDSNLRRQRFCKSCGAVRHSVEVWTAEPAKMPKKRRKYRPRSENGSPRSTLRGD